MVINSNRIIDCRAADVTIELKSGDVSRNIKSNQIKSFIYLDKQIQKKLTK